MVWKSFLGFRWSDILDEVVFQMPSLLFPCYISSPCSIIARVQDIRNVARIVCHQITWKSEGKPCWSLPRRYSRKSHGGIGGSQHSTVQCKRGTDTTRHQPTCSYADHHKATGSLAFCLERSWLFWIGLKKSGLTELIVVQPSRIELKTHFLQFIWSGWLMWRCFFDLEVQHTKEIYSTLLSVRSFV